MKLLLDENLSRRIVPFIQDAFPGSTQVASLNMASASDVEIWQYAKSNGYVIVTKDADFQELCLLHGTPPKVLWLRIGNTSKAAITHLLIEHRSIIEETLSQSTVDYMEIE